MRDSLIDVFIFFVGSTRWGFSGVEGILGGVDFGGGSICGGWCEVELASEDCLLLSYPILGHVWMDS